MSILSRSKLPAWCSPMVDTAKRFSVFHGVSAKIREFVFTTSAAGVVFEAEFLHVRTGCREVVKGVHPIPADVLITAGVESKRRKK